MEIFSNNTISFLSSILLTVPLMWGVYEFRKFRFQLDDIKKKANEINKKIDDITKNRLDNYPLILDIKEMIDKINKVFKP
tara:strand:- start:1536 stop:1775 length:240 start_codon:yes stop_codon:yes gene_type:complete